MILNYFKTTLRMIWRHRVHSIINIAGLGVGMACTILILLWVRFEFSFDRHHENAGRIYRLATDFHFGAFQGKYAVSNHPAGPTLQRDLYNPIEPLFMENDPTRFNYALVKIRPGNMAEAIGFLEKKWKEIDSSGAFHYWLLEEDHASNYRPIRQVGALFVGFTLVAILIACMGLFGLALFSAERRTREIGIRKALGATVTDIARLPAQSSIKWVLAANIFAWPLTYWFSAGWLEDYPYRIEVGIGIYSVAGLSALVIALLTVSWQAVKSARKNPVDALRYE